MSELRQCKTPHGLITVLLGDDQEKLSGRANNLAGDVKDVMADRFDGGPMILGRQDQVFEPGD